MPQRYRLYAPRDLRRESFDLPPLGPHDVHLRSRLGAISSGTESAWYFGTDPNLAPGFKPLRFDHPTFPRFLGYEKVAEVVAIGSEVDGVAAGQRVIAPYGHATEYIWPADQLAPIPDDIRDEEAVFSTLFNVAAQAIRRSELQLGDDVFVTGAGVVGLACIISARLAGANRIIVSDRQPARLALARQFGADILLNPADEDVAAAIVDRYGPECIDIALECSSSYEALADTMAVTRRNGKVCVVGQLKGPYPAHPLFGMDFHLGELTMISSDGGWDIARHARWFFGAIQRGLIRDLASLISHRVPFGELETGFGYIEHEPGAMTKVVVEYN
ncbi:MAG: zinc-binding alcohol dehydrogenase [Ardenticatenales bacterium]|nr:zinc-binding alcohol dehydrogenase [Ardenticatenales bacterium]